MTHLFPIFSYVHQALKHIKYGTPWKRRPWNRFMAALLISVLFLVGIHPAEGWSLATAPPIPEASIDLEPLSSHTFENPVFVTPFPGDPSQFIVVEQEGRLLSLQDGKVQKNPFLDIGEKLSTGGERGLLGLAFHPQFPSNGRFFVNYTRGSDGATVIAEYHATPSSPIADTQERILLVISQPYSNHNGGMIAFGPDGYLYIGTGDGGSGGDPDNHAQNPQELLGKFLRIDVDRFSPYAIPPDNPLVRGTGKPEIFALGLRNPWRFSFDRQTGDLWAGDVGQNRWEEVNIIHKGKNYGWRLLEGRHCYNPSSNCELAPSLVPPVTEYRHEGGRCSVTGGYVYRGKHIPELEGTYIFGDYCSGEIWGYRNGGTRLLTDTDLQISSFGEDSEGELYVVDHQGRILKIVPKPISPASS